MRFVILLIFLCPTLSGQSNPFIKVFEPYKYEDYSLIESDLDSLLSISINSPKAAEQLVEALFLYNKKVALSQSAIECINETFARCLSFLENSNYENDTNLCSLYISYGGNLKYRGKYIQAIKNLKKADWYYKLSSDSLLEQKSKIHYNLAEAWSSLDKNQLAILQADSSMTIARKLNLNKHKRRCLNVYEKSFLKVNDIFLATSYSALGLFYTYNYESKKNRDKALLKRISNLFKQKKLDSTYAMLQPYLEDRNRGIKNKNIDSDLSSLLMRIYNLERNTSEIYKLYEYRKINEKTKDKHIINELQFLQYNIKQLNIPSKNHALHKEIIDHYKNKSSKLSRNEAEFYLTLSRNAELNKNLKQAYIYSIKADSTFKSEKNYTSNNLESFINTKSYLIRTHLNLLNENLNNKSVNKLEEEVREVFENITPLINKIQDDHSKYFLINESDQSELIDACIHACYLILEHSEGKNNEIIQTALGFMEMDKSLILIRNAISSREKYINKYLSKCLELKNSIRNEIKILENDSLDLELRKAVADNIENKLFELRSIYDQNKLPRYIHKEFINKDILKLENNFIEFHQSENGSFYSISRINNSLRFNILNLNAEFLVGSLDTLINNTAELDLAFLSKKLSIPFPDSLPSKLIIIPSGILSYIPFEAILHNGQKIIEKCTVSYGFSLNHLNTIKNYPKSSSNEIFCFAPNYNHNSKSTNTHENFNIERTGKSNNNLIYNKEEIKNIKIFYPQTKLFIGEKAEKSSFIKNKEKGKIIHIAAHAISSNIESENKIYFSERDTTNQELTLSEIYNLDFNADLVTLSACQTGLGKFFKGEGVISLARGFAYGGAKSVVNSLWNANDASTSEIMTNFYKNLSEGQAKDEALRNAKLSYLESAPPSRRHPYYWATFIATGDMSPLDLKDNKDIKSAILILGLITALLIISISVIKRKTKSAA